MVPRSENKWRVAVTAQELQDKKWTSFSCLLPSLSVDSATLDCTSTLSFNLGTHPYLAHPSQAQSL